MSWTPRIAILLASYNGGRFIGEQLDSLARQSYQNWRLVVSDDRSTDATRQIVEDFSLQHPSHDVTVIEGPQKGATLNFLSLIDHVQPDEALAFCDQDDVWLPHRLAAGVQGLQYVEQARPALHVTRTVICDEDLKQLAPAPLYTRPASFRNALVQACTPGNTMLVNVAGAGVLQRAVGCARNANIISHDWWSYQAISGAGGSVIRDPAQTVLYRQHSGNVMGRNDTFRAILARLKGLGGGDYAGWLRANIAALECASDVLTPENRRLLTEFLSALDAAGPAAARRLAQLGLYRQTKAGTIALYAAAAAGRLR